jgi:hypothetical protein
MKNIVIILLSCFALSLTAQVKQPVKKTAAPKKETVVYTTETPKDIALINQAPMSTTRAITANRDLGSTLNPVLQAPLDSLKKVGFHTTLTTASESEAMDIEIFAYPRQEQVDSLQIGAKKVAKKSQRIVLELIINSTNRADVDLILSALNAKSLEAFQEAEKKRKEDLERINKIMPLDKQ